jgi:hypothetical protein
MYAILPNEYFGLFLFISKNNAVLKFLLEILAYYSQIGVEQSDISK